MFQLTTVLDGDRTSADSGFVSAGNIASRNDGCSIDADVVNIRGKCCSSIAFGILPVGNVIPVTIGSKDQHIILGLEEGRNESAFVYFAANTLHLPCVRRVGSQVSGVIGSGSDRDLNNAILRRNVDSEVLSGIGRVLATGLEGHLAAHLDARENQPVVGSQGTCVVVIASGYNTV